MRILGTGLDVVDVARFTLDNLRKTIPILIPKNFTEEEIATCDARGEPDRAEAYAARWAAKEAYLKALGRANLGHPPLEPNPDLREIAVRHDPKGVPFLEITGRLAQVAAQLGVKDSFLSLSHDGPIAAASVTLVG